MASKFSVNAPGTLHLTPSGNGSLSDAVVICNILLLQIQEYIDGLVEVHGIVNCDNSIGAEQYIMLADQQTAQTFGKFYH